MSYQAQTCQENVIMQLLYNSDIGVAYAHLLNLGLILLVAELVWLTWESYDLSDKKNQVCKMMTLDKHLSKLLIKHFFTDKNYIHFFQSINRNTLINFHTSLSFHGRYSHFILIFTTTNSNRLQIWGEISNLLLSIERTCTKSNS